MNQMQDRRRDNLDSIEALINRFVARLRLQRAITGAVEGACLGLMLAAVGLAAMRTGWTDPDQWWLWALLAGGFTLAGAFLRALQKVDPISAAQTIDRTHGLHDRLSSAMVLAEQDELSHRDAEFIRAQLRDALHHLGSVNTSRAAPWRRPADTTLLAVVALSVIAVGLIPIADHTQPLPEPFRVVHGPVLDSATVEMERDRLRELRRRIAELPDDEAEALADEIEALLDAVEAREISEREFLEAIDDILERYFGEDLAGKELDTLSEALAEAAQEIRDEHAEALAREEELQRAMEALEDGDFQAAADALSDLADRLKNDELSAEEAERLAELLESFAEKLDGRDERLQELFEQHRDAFEELAQQFEESGEDGEAFQENPDGDAFREDPDGKDELLEEARAAMDQAAQDSDDYEQSSARRQLQELSRQLEETAEQLRQQGGGGDESGDDQDAQAGEAGEDGDQDSQVGEQADGQQRDSGDPDDPNYRNEIGRQMDDASEQLQEMERQRQRQQQREQARRQLEEMRESMSRSDGDGGERDDRRGDQMREFMERARGEESQQGDQGQQGEQGEQGEQADQRGDQQGDGQQSGDPQDGEAQDGQTGDGAPQDGGEGGDGEEGADAAGSGGPGEDMLDGQAEEMEAQYQREDLSGQENEEGRSRSEIIRSASEEGFATIDYQDVYADYHDIAEEVMEREAVPDGYRYYIQRYFQLIRPQQ